ncbi:MAG: hypothetical protein COB49_08655 [Alphaproteobacteria bacterium]|nr:MAG: hypothetical protein COB49_08655 [Alphaproteobacteria bacterium]
MKQNTRQNRQGRSGQHNNQKRPGKGRHNQNRQQQPNSPTRQIDSRGPAGNQRGNAKQLYERYKDLAQEKRVSDRLEAEALGQYADHYYRVHAEFAAAEAASQKVREEAREKEQARKDAAEAERQARTAAAEQSPAPEQVSKVEETVEQKAEAVEPQS